MWGVDRTGGAAGRMLVSVAAVAVVTAAIALVKPYVPVLSLGVLYVFAVLPVAVLWGLVYAIPVSIASMLAFNWFFLPPVHTFTLADSRNWFALAVYVVTAIVVSDLASRSRRRAREAALLAQIASSLIERGSVVDDLDEIAAAAAAALRVDTARIDLSGRSSPARGEIARSLDAGGRAVGTIYVSRPRFGDVASRRVLPSLASMLAVAIDRERLERDAVEAEALRRSDLIKTALLRAVSHDLRSPLMAIGTAAGTLAAFDGALSDDDRRDLLDAILAESNRLDRLVGDLLDLSRLQAGALHSQRRRCTTRDLVGRALGEIGEEAARIDVDPSVALHVEADPAQIQRALVNLIENALKYTPAGAPVAVSVGIEGEDAVTRVDDGGPGLSGDEFDRVFEPFERGSAMGAARGAGLGLAIARGFVEANGGRLWAEPGKLGGASFALSLPLVPEVAEGSE